VSADILSLAQRRAVEALALVWGGTYDIGFKGGRYYARRYNGTGEALEALTPGELDVAIRADQVRQDTP